MLASNFVNLIEHFWNKEKKAFNLDPNDEIIRGCLVTHAGEIVNERLKG
jgi:NAD(P) transhydrogenase subunit alpha